MNEQEIKEEIVTILKSCNEEDWVWDGENELPVRNFNIERAKEKIFELILKSKKCQQQ